MFAEFTQALFLLFKYIYCRKSKNIWLIKLNYNWNIL